MTRRLKAVYSEKQFKLTIVKPPEATGSSVAADESPKLGIHIIGDNVLLQRISRLSNYSFSSCEGFVDTFKSMFKSSNANKMTFSRTMLSHLIGDDLGPDRQIMISDLIASNSGFKFNFTI